MTELTHIEKAYEKGTPLKDVNAVINDGDVIAVIGPSGSGKSTLLRCINLMGTPTAGEIWVNGKKIDMQSKSDVAMHHRKIGMVFQAFNLLENLTAIENVMMPQIEVLGKSRKEAYDTAIRLLDEVGLGKEWK